MIKKTPTVLLIDDDAVILRTLARALRGGLGWEILTASDPVAAAVLYDRADIVITDWTMPGGGGARVLAECNKPVIVMSASGDVVHPHVVPKPATLDAIEGAIRAIAPRSVQT